METIFALSSGKGKAGVSVIRISGNNAFEAFNNFGIDEAKIIDRQAHLVNLKNFSGQIIDKSLVLKFNNPASFTGENTVEIHCHGSIAVVRIILESLSNIHDFRLAEAGEFSQRAFLNGKMDLLQAEGLADLIDSETESQIKQAMRQFRGENSEIYENWRSRIIEIMAFTEAYVDFPDEDIPEKLDLEALEKVSNLKSEIEENIFDNRGLRLREGIVCTIIGKANVGKSTLINFFSKREIAIVSDMAGTTRDSLESHLDINGYPVTLIDTAGIRESLDSIEQIGVQKALEKANSADIIILVLDATDVENNGDNIAEFQSMLNDDSVILINKIDEAEENYVKSLEGHITNNTHITPLKISLKNKDNLDDLMDFIGDKIEKNVKQVEPPLITRQRHRNNLNDCCSELGKFLESKDMEIPIELKAEILRKAGYHIGKVTGKVDVEDVLDKIFSEFCIGK